MTTLTMFFQEAWAAAAKRRQEQRRRQKFYAVALAFNDLHTHTRRNGQWMCPTCNKVHDALPETSVFTGLQYPRCCEFEEGHRLHEKWQATTCNTKAP